MRLKRGWDLRLVLPLGGALALGLGVAALGGVGAVERGIVLLQRDFQAVLAGGIRALKADAPMASAALIWLGFLYGVIHAAGPGHGKVVLGSWAFSARASLMRVAVITVLAAFAQASVAVGLVLGGAAAFGLGRKELSALAEGPVERASDFMIAGLGLWLLWRGLRGLWRARAARVEAHHHHDHHEHHDHHHDHCGCGHAHAPDLDAAAKASLPEALVLIGSVALRPCTGALFMLLLTLKIGAPMVGVAAVYAMGLGTALITLIVALGAVSLREGLGTRLAQSRALKWVGHSAELALGALILWLVLR